MPLSPHLGKTVDFAGREENLAWKLELEQDNSKNWKITNLKTLCLLQETNTIQSEGTVVGCSEKRFVATGGRQSWILR